MGLHHVDAREETGVVALAVRHHEPLDAVADRHAANQAVVHGVDVVEEVALRTGVLGVFPAQKLGDVRARVGVHQLVLFGDELHFLVFNLLLNLGAEGAVLELLAEVADLVVVDAAEVLVSEPRTVFCAGRGAFSAGHLLGSEHEVQVGLVGVHHKLAVVLRVASLEFVEAAVHFHTAKVEGLVHHLGAVHQGHIAALRFVEVQHGSVARRHAAVQAHFAHFVSVIGFVDTTFPFGRDRHIGLRRGRGCLGVGRFCCRFLRCRSIAVSAAEGQQSSGAKGPNHGLFHSFWDDADGEKNAPFHPRI